VNLAGPICFGIKAIASLLLSFRAFSGDMAVVMLSNELPSSFYSIESADIIPCIVLAQAMPIRNQFKITFEILVRLI